MRIKRITAGTFACLIAGAIALPFLYHTAPAKPVAASHPLVAAEAMWPRPHTVEALDSSADVVVRGTVKAITDGPPLGSRYPSMATPTKRITIDVTDHMHGQVGDTVTVAWVGGRRSDGTDMYVAGDPPYAVGDDVVVYLDEGTPGVYHLSVPDGRFDVADGRVQSRVPNGPGHALSGLTVAELKAKVQR